MAPRFCADRVMPYPREEAILAQAVDHSNPQHNLFHLDLVFANVIYGTTVLKKDVVPDFKWLQAHICRRLSDIPGNRWKWGFNPLLLMVSLADEIPMITKGESVLYKYAVGSDVMLLKYCDMLNIENQHLYDSNEELSRWVLHLETALETLESRVFHVDRWMKHCLSLHVHGDGSVENPFTLEGGDLWVSVMFDLTDPYPIEPVRVGGGVVLSGNWTCCIYVFLLNFYFLMFLRNFLLCFPY